MTGRLLPRLRKPAPVFLLAGLLACSTGTRTTPDAAPELSRAVLISLDGLGGTRLNELLAAGKLTAGGFAAFAERGLLAGRAVTVTPSLTPTAHISAITGAPPSRTGIVANYFREPGTAFGRAATGFAASIQTETLWEAALRQNKRVGVLLYPGADGEGEKRRGSFGLIWPEHPAQESSFVTLEEDRWKVAAPGVAPGERTFSPAREARLVVEAPGTSALPLRLVALDSTDDGAVDYDLIRIERDDVPRSVVERARRNGWFRVEAPGPEGVFTAWCRVNEIDPGLKRVVLYIGAFYELPAYPEDYRRRLEAEVGGWPGPPDGTFYRTERLSGDDDAYEEQATRLAGYLTRVLVFTIRTERWDLLLGYQPIVDEIQHSFEPGPAGGSRERVERAIATTDRSLAAVLAALGPRDSLFVHSDHGIVPLEHAVNLEKFLGEKGWTIAREGRASPAGARRVQVGATSGIAHLYVDPELPAAERDVAAEALLKDARDLARLPENVVDEVLFRKDLGRVDLDNPRSGDVVVLLKPGAEFRRSGANVVGPSPQKGGHGYRNATPVLDACFMALGPGISPSRPATVSLLDVAPLVARSLGIQPPGR